MSASDRLRALNEAEDYGQLGDSTDALWTALPLIADVVEAAEGVAHGATHWKEAQDQVEACRTTVTALREHLEGGDVT